MLKCKIIQDLLPLYCDKLTSPESNEEIEKHLHECEDCTQIYENICVKEESIIENPEKDIQPLKKVKRKFLIRLVFGIIVSAIAIFDLFILMFKGFSPIKSEKLDMDISLTDEILYSGIDNGNFEVTDVKKENVKMLNIQFTGDYIGIRGERNADFIGTDDGTFRLNYELTFYPVIIPNSNTYNLGITFREGDTMTIHYQDRDVVYDLTELMEQAEKENK